MHGFVNAKLDCARIVKFLEDLDVCVTAACILNLRPAEFDISFYSKHNCTFGVFRRRRRNTPADQSLGRVNQHSVWLARLFVFGDFTAEWVWSVLVNACDLQRSTVCDGAMTISASEDHRIVWCDFIEVPTCREHGRLPVCFDPSAASHPLAWLCLIYACFHLGEKVSETR